MQNYYFKESTALHHKFKLFTFIQNSNGLKQKVIFTGSAVSVYEVEAAAVNPCSD